MGRISPQHLLELIRAQAMLDGQGKHIDRLAGIVPQEVGAQYGPCPWVPMLTILHPIVYTSQEQWLSLMEWMM